MLLMFRCNHQQCRLRRKMTGVGDGSTTSDLRHAATTFRLTTGETLAEASTSGMLVLVFLRHFGCTFTRQILGKLEELENFAQRHDARLVLVHMLKSGGEIRYLGGHGDAMGGVVVASPELAQSLRPIRTITGGVMDPFTAYLMLRGDRKSVV